MAIPIALLPCETSSQISACAIFFSKMFSFICMEAVRHGMAR
jgi:hypothetical protein